MGYDNSDFPPIITTYCEVCVSKIRSKSWSKFDFLIFFWNGSTPAWCNTVVLKEERRKSPSFRVERTAKIVVLRYIRFTITFIRLPDAQQAISVGREGIVCLSLSYLIQKLLELLVADLGVVATSKRALVIKVTLRLYISKPNI